MVRVAGFVVNNGEGQAGAVGAAGNAHTLGPGILRYAGYDERAQRPKDGTHRGSAKFAK